MIRPACRPLRRFALEFHEMKPVADVVRCGQRTASAWQAAQISAKRSVITTAGARRLSFRATARLGSLSNSDCRLADRPRHDAFICLSRAFLRTSTSRRLSGVVDEDWKGRIRLMSVQ